MSTRKSNFSGTIPNEAVDNYTKPRWHHRVTSSWARVWRLINTPEIHNRDRQHLDRGLCRLKSKRIGSWTSWTSITNCGYSKSTLVIRAIGVREVPDWLRFFCGARAALIDWILSKFGRIRWFMNFVLFYRCLRWN